MADDATREEDSLVDGEAGEPLAEARAAVAAVRREGYKAAVVHAAAEAAVLLLAVNLAAGVAGVPALDAEVGLPGSLPAVPVRALLAAGAGLAAFAAGVGLRVRRPLVEQFEAANPEVREALRTARDAARDGRSNPMARALYADTLDRLQEASGPAVVDTTRVAAAIAVAVALSLASVQAAVVGFEVGAGPGGGGGAGPGNGTVVGSGAATTGSGDLHAGEEVLGSPTNVTAGSENLSAAVGSARGGEGDREYDYGSDAGGGGGGTAVEARRAGYAPPERVENADLVRRYASALNNQTDV